MSKHFLRKHFTELYAFLVKTVDIPYKSLEHYFVFKMSQKGTKCLRCQLVADDNARWAAAFEVLIAIFIFFTTGKRNNLCGYVSTQFLLACAALDIHIGV